MGSLYWQANDCWQVASWSGMDYFGRWKALMYYTKRFYSPQLISPYVEENGNLNVYVVSDSPQAKQAQMILKLFDLQGKIVSSKHVGLTVEPLRGKSYFTEPAKKFLNGADEKSTFLLAELNVDGKVVSTNQYFFRPFKDLSVSRPNIKTTISASANGFKVSLTTDTLAKSVYLSGFTEGFFTDNYFDLIPQRIIEIEFQTKQKMSLDEFRQRLKIRSLNDAFS